ncbi:MAG: hypothetical protein J7J20_05050 [Desulfurococcales archaeon]|nr:hypothetical protein [Desulfurococcales archaeon]
MKSSIRTALTKFGFAALILMLCIYASSTSLLSSSETLSGGYAGQRFVMIKVPAVYMNEKGVMHGVATELLAGAGWPGNGTVYFSAEPLTQIDMQAATRVAAMIACTMAGVSMENYDFFVRFRSESIVVGGPSASGATTVALLAILTGAEVLPNISMTGMIEPDGTIGPVGGVLEKLEAMAKAGVKVFLIPKGQSVIKEFKKVVENKTVGGAVIITEKVVPVTVNVTELGEKLGVKVVEVGSVAEAFEYFTGRELKLPKFKREYPDWLRHIFTVLGERMSRSAESNLSLAKSTLKKSGAITKLLDDASSHLSNYNTLLSEGKYYSAASEAFQAAILASYVASLAKASKGLTTEDVVSQLRSEVLRYANACGKIMNSAEKLFKELSYKPMTDVRLQLAIAAYQRLVNANESLSTAYRARLYPPSVGGDALYYAIYAYWRAETAYSYLRMALDASEGIELSKNLLSKGVNTLLYFTVSVDAYLSSLGGGSYGVDITRAMKLISEGKYIEAAAYVVTALTYDVSAMHAYYSTQEKLAPYAREGAEVLAGRVQDLGLTPILSMLYLERAETVNESLAKIRLYEEASAYSLLLINSVLTKPKPPLTTTHIKQEKVVTVTTPATETTTVTATTTITHTVPAGHGSSREVLETVGVNIISFLVGVLAGALISLAVRRSL